MYYFKILIAACFIFMAGTSFAQNNIFPSSGNAGIGTTNPNPLSLLDAYGTNNPKIALRTATSEMEYAIATCTGCYSSFAQPGDGVIRLLGKGKSQIFDTGSSFGYNQNFKFVAGGKILLFINDNHRIGVGTTNPKSMLHIANGDLRLSANREIYFEDNGQIRSLDNHHRIMFRRNADIMELREHGDIIFSSGATSGNATNNMVVKANGNVGIGTFTPGNRLDVCGTVRANEVRVESGWCDYVFADDYQLPSIKEEAQHIAEKGYLSGFQSEKEMDGEILVGDVTKRQQEKIEQMMLHIIELNKQVEQLQAQMAK